MSLDQIGPLGKNVSDVALVLSVIAGKDEKDTRTFDCDVKMKKAGNIKVGILRINGTDNKIQKLIDNKVEEIKKKLKWKAEEIKIEHIDLAVETYYPLVYSEFFSGKRRFDGRK